MRVSRVFFFAVISCSLSHGAFAQAAAQAREAPLSPQQTELIDTFVGAEMARQHIPGLAVGIYSRGRILLAKGYGLANVELSASVRPETIFQSGSVCKQFGPAVRRNETAL
jgi:CubicO group peptidase (beta-lactamase class C family)